MYKISDDSSTIVVEKTAESSDYDTFVSELPKDECRYAVYDFEYEKPGEGQRNKICFMAWYVVLVLFYVSSLTAINLRSPDTSKIKQKMLYASSKDAIRKKLVGIASEIQATDLSEISYDIVLDKVSKSVSF